MTALCVAPKKTMKNNKKALRNERFFYLSFCSSPNFLGVTVGS